MDVVGASGGAGAKEIGHDAMDGYWAVVFGCDFVFGSGVGVYST
jgi:hypothetical protein